MRGCFGLCVLALAIPLAMAASTAMPTTNLKNWRLIFNDDFVTDVPLGSFPGPYSKSWMSYDGFGDTSDVGWYDPSKVLSVSNGMLDFYMHTDTTSHDPTVTKPLGAAPVPFLKKDGYWGGQLYGRHSVRFRADAIANYGTGWLLWSDAEDWNDGEIDFPEGMLDGTIHFYDHCVGNPGVNCYLGDTGAHFTSWHTATIEWTPSYVAFLLDDVYVGNTTSAVPKKNMHWVLQSCTNGVRPDPTASGHIQIDWVAIWAWDTTAVPPTTATLAPSPKPTTAPTPPPTSKPTVAPTRIPTASPTAKPTIKPTVRPTSPPSVKPTSSPSVKPTSPPSVKPTSLPSVKPTSPPSVKPTSPATAKPTVAPTLPPCGAAQGVWTDSFTTINTNTWHVADGYDWGATYFSATQVKPSSTGLTLEMTKTGCPSSCGTDPLRSGKLETYNSYSAGTVKIKLQTSAYGVLWFGWEGNNPREGWEVTFEDSFITVRYYKNSNYNWGGGVALPYDATAAFHDYTIARKDSSLQVFADGSLIFNLATTNLPTTAGTISFTYQSDDTIDVTTAAVKMSSFTYLPVGCPFKA